MTSLLPLLRRIDQIGVITPDLDKASAGMHALLGVEPHTRMRAQYRDVVYRGRTVDAAMDVAFFDVLGLEVELIQPTPIEGGEPADVWQEFIAEGRTGLHHIRFDITDHDAVMAAMAELGVEPIQVGSSVRSEAMRYAYYDTSEQLGFLTETFHIPSEI